MRCLRDRPVERDRRLHRLNSAVTFVAAHNRVYRIEDCDVNDRHGATGASWSELLAKGANFARRYRCVIDSARIDRDLVPAMKRVESILGNDRSARGLSAAETR